MRNINLINSLCIDNNVVRNGCKAWIIRITPRTYTVRVYQTVDTCKTCVRTCTIESSLECILFDRVSANLNLNLVCRVCYTSPLTREGKAIPTCNDIVSISTLTYIVPLNACNSDADRVCILTLILLYILWIVDRECESVSYTNLRLVKSYSELCYIATVLENNLRYSKLLICVFCNYNRNSYCTLSIATICSICKHCSISRVELYISNRTLSLKSCCIREIDIIATLHLWRAWLVGANLFTGYHTYCRQSEQSIEKFI